MKTFARLIGAVKVIGAAGMLASAMGLTGAWMLVIPVIGFAAGQMAASGRYSLLTGRIA